MRTVYATQFQLPPNPGQNAEGVVQDLRTRASTWLVDKYGKIWNQKINPEFDGEVLSPVDGHILRTHARRVDGSEIVTVEWAHPHDRDPTAAWQTTLVVGRHGEDVEVAVYIRIATMQMSMRPVGFALGRPRFITDLLSSYTPRINGWEIPRGVEVIKAADVERYVKQVLLSEARCLPVVMVSPDTWTDRPVIDTDELSESLRGFAHVAVLESKWASFKLTDVIGKELGCYNGAVRVYWPGFAVNANPFDHRLFMPDNLKVWRERGFPLGKHLFRILASISAFRFVEGAATRAARKVMSEADRAQVLRLAEEAKQGRVTKEQLETQLLNALVKIEEVTKERDQLKDELDAQKSAWADYQQFMQPEAGEQQAAAAAEPVAPQSVGDVVRAAAKSSGPAVMYLESAVESADDSPFKNPERVAEVLEAIGIVASEWVKKNGALGRTWEDAFKDLGFEYKDKISTTTKTKWGSDYEFKYNGEKRMFEKHITLGSGQADTCLSVHWYLDEDEKQKDKSKKRRRLVIGHCGRHLTNTKS